MEAKGRPSSEYLAFERGKAAFREGVVVAVAFRAHALAQPVASQTPSGQRGAVLAAAIRMEERARCHLATVYGALQGVGDKARVQTLGDAPAQERAAEEIEDDCQVAPALFSGDIGDVTDQMGAGCLGGSGPDQQVGRTPNDCLRPSEPVKVGAPVNTPAMSASFAELDFRQTPLSELTLRRRQIAALEGLEVYEVKLGDAFLMSSLFHEVEVALADLGLAGLDEPLDVVVGGLGLGYTPRAALKHPAVRSLLVVEALEPVIEWHERGLVPLGPELTGDAHCRFVHGDFFALAASGQGFDPAEPCRKFHAVLLDIDHSPRNLLHSRHGAFYGPAGLRELAAHLHPDGVFALWSDDPPDEPS